MKLALVALLVAGCHHEDAEAKARALPKPAAFAKLTDDQKCAAVAPRSLPCEDALLKAELVDVLGSAAGSDPRLGEKMDDKEAAAVEQVRCATPKYVDAVLSCWPTVGCDAFAKCVVGAER